MGAFAEKSGNVAKAVKYYEQAVKASQGDPETVDKLLFCAEKPGYSGVGPNFLPWLGFFDKMRKADLFVLVDHVQYERQNYQNRTRIKTADGPRWITVPVCQNSRAERIVDKLIGDVFMAQCSIYRPNAIGAWRYPVPPDASPKTVDWERYLGNAPKRPFDAARLVHGTRDALGAILDTLAFDTEIDLEEARAGRDRRRDHAERRQRVAVAAGVDALAVVVAGRAVLEPDHVELGARGGGGAVAHGDDVGRRRDFDRQRLGAGAQTRLRVVRSGGRLRRRLQLPDVSRPRARPDRVRRLRGPL